MSRPRFQVLNVLDEDQGNALQARPRFLQPLEFSTVPCASCPGNCCMLDVRLTAVEALRLAITLRTPLLSVVTTVPAGSGTPALFYAPPIPLEGGPVTLALRRRAPDGRCQFLYDLGNSRRCAIHGLRPGVCRVYPFDIRMGSRRLAVGSQLLCPVRWLKTRELETSLRKDVARWDADLAEEAALLRDWEAQAERSGDAFLRFAGTRVAVAMGVDPAPLFPEPRRRLGKAWW